MKPEIIVLLGEKNCGKSSIIKKLLDVKGRKRLHHKEMKNRIIYIYGSGSPQELSKFCNVKEVMKKINKRIQKTIEFHKNGRHSSKKMTLLLPFTIVKQNGKLNKMCIVTPIRRLRRKYNVKVIYLEKRDKDFDRLVGKTIPNGKIISYKNDERRQSEELKRFI